MQNSTFAFVANVVTKHFKKGGDATDTDRNGNYPLQLNVIAGKCPSRAIVINGTVGEAAGIKAGNTYVFQVSLRDVNEYGANYNHTVLGQLNPMDLIQLPNFVKAYGQPAIVGDDVSTNTEVDAPAMREKAVTDFGN